jgi:non-ribosomal peptide synthetase-like protein
MSKKSLILGKVAPDFIKIETLPVLLKPSFEIYAEKAAFIFKDQSITYKDLDNWSNQIASFLKEKGVKSGDKVGLWYPRSLELPVAILGILKAGAAYIPLDREMPKERVQNVFTEINVTTYFSDEDADIHCIPVSIPAFEKDKLVHFALDYSNENWAYVLFTSGSTGKPKGIPISHKNICHLIRSENDFIQIKSTDKVYQGFSVSFDMWCEEVWISLFVGATIWIADAFTVKAIDELSNVLIQQQITVLHAVPSILAIIDEAPALRIVNAGGEACTPQVLKKWSKPYRTFINSYGPTETTVTSNMAILSENDSITIGNPLPNYHIAVINENLEIVPLNERGEMIISGPGVSNGYLNLPKLTAEKFLPNPFPEMYGETIYKTGDAVVFQENGFIDFQGRIDDQIKLRGYRIELGEIESRLNQLEYIASASVAIRKDSNDQDQLVGYVKLKPAVVFDEDNIRKSLAAFLAPYMVPVAIVEISEMPRMPSGKIDRKKLPTPATFLKKNETEKELEFNTNDTVNEKVLKSLKFVFPGKEINLEKDFFTDLGGHSLLAATFVSYLRQKGNLQNASLKDVYEHRPLKAFANNLENSQTHTSKTREAFHRVSNLQYYLCNIAQTVSLFFLYGLLAIQIFFPYLSYYYFNVNEHGHFKALLSAFAVYTLIPSVFSLLIIGFKKVFIGKFKEGDYNLWGWYYFKWWLWQSMKRLLPSQFIVDTPLHPRFLKLLGAKVSPSATLSALNIGAEDLLIIDENVSTSSGCVIDNASVENGFLKLRKVHLKANAYLGSSAIVGGNCIIEPFGELQDLSYLPANHIIGKGEVWDGSPAQKIKTFADNELPIINTISPAKRYKYSALYLFTLFLFPLIIIVPLFPTLYILYVLDDSAGSYDFTYLWQAPFLALSYLILFVLVVSIIARICTRKIQAGTFSVYSFTYYKKWFKDQLMSISLIVLHPLYASIYISKFYRMLGARVGKNSEISTASDVTHHLFEIGEGSFIADAVILGEHDVKNQQLILSKTVIGNRSFVGNSGLIPQGYALGDDMLIGVLSKPPTAEQLKKSNEKDWFGSPPIGLPSRQRMDNFDTKQTFAPTIKLKLARGIVEGIRIIIPQTIVLISSVLFIAYSHDLLVESIPKLLLFLPFYYLGFMAIPAFLFTVVFKWILVGKYKRNALPMYHYKVWFSEAVTSIYEALSVSFFLDLLRGTMWLPIFVRMLGVKTGEKVWLNTTDITEFDMVSIGDETMMNDGCGPQTHLFEDRIMKIGSVEIGKQTTIGSRTIILYDSKIGNHVTVDSLSLLMKGEELPDNTDWIGSPVILK